LDEDFFTSLGFTWRIGFTFTAGLNEPGVLENCVWGVLALKFIGGFGVLGLGD